MPSPKPPIKELGLNPAGRRLKEIARGKARDKAKAKVSAFRREVLAVSEGRLSEAEVMGELFTMVKERLGKNKGGRPTKLKTKFLQDIIERHRQRGEPLRNARLARLLSREVRLAISADRKAISFASEDITAFVEALRALAAKHGVKSDQTVTTVINGFLISFAMSTFDNIIMAGSYEDMSDTPFAKDYQPLDFSSEGATIAAIKRA
ncbi:MAG: hypothetical protein ACRD2G_12465 [Terriglobia bacterium]